MTHVMRSPPRDHPRLCGEHMHDIDSRSRKLGSSPLVRGARMMGSHAGLRHGIIPACAGSTRPRLRAVAFFRDHPRLCGEHAFGLWSASRVSGSSPLVRGAPMPLIFANRRNGIIPACAGSTFLSESFSPPMRDHPRLCGEHTITTEPVTTGTGSSPLVRGAPLRARQDLMDAGIIPACAGSTLQSEAYLLMSRDHPRLCGEHWSKRCRRWRRRGSSPLVRGAREQEVLDLRGRGIIPACAGST